MSTIISDNLRWAKEQLTTYYNKLPDWSYLVPTIGALGVSAMFVPHVCTGIAVGLGASVFSLATGYDTCKQSKDGTSLCSRSPTIHALIPAAQETLLRGLIQPLIKGALSFHFPSTMSPLLGTGLSSAAAASIIALPIFITIAHLYEHRKAKNQKNQCRAVLGILTNVMQGMIAEKFGLAAAIASHVVRHTVPMTYQKWPFESLENL